MAKTPTDIRSLARAHTETALRTLAGIMQEPSAPHAVRVSAAIALLEKVSIRADHKTAAALQRNAGRNVDHQTMGSDIAK